MINYNAQAFTRHAIHKRGVEVTFQRNVGEAPNSTAITATVMAVVKSYLPNTTLPATQGIGAHEVGALSMGDRFVLVMADDLANEGFPLPLQKGDLITPTLLGETLTLTAVDPLTRAMAGAIEAKATSV